MLARNNAILIVIYCTQISTFQEENTSIIYFLNLKREMHQIRCFCGLMAGRAARR
jgi:hypothetical protein